jgi:uncharacterized protein YfaS (alpha-2-macroglobulin family)
MEVSYLDKNKKVISPDRMVEGSTFYAVVDVRYSSGVIKPLSNGALKQIFPSGWEITNLRLNNDPSTQSDPFVYQDIRDDRVYTFFHLKDRKISRYVIPLTATYRGTWYLPAQKAGDMYDGSFSATIPGKWVQVIAQTK